MEKSIIVVGAGISGLSAGCYARMNGFDTSIYEMHKIPGGLCTAWSKKGYTFDISMHMLTGSLSGPFHEMWEELGVTENFDFYYPPEMNRVEGMGNKLRFSVNRKEFETDMMTISPGDSKLIRALSRVMFGPDLMEAASLKPKEFQNIFDRIRSLPSVLPLVRLFMKYNKVSVQEFAGRFKHPFLREAVRYLIDAPGWPMPDFPMIALIGFIKNGVTGAGVPLGGSQKVAFHVAELFNELGGEINFNSRVDGLIIENDQVEGIRLEDGTERRADYVIWAGDGHTLHYDLLGGKYLDERIRNMYENWQPVKPITHVMLGVNRDLSDEPHRLILEMNEPITIAGYRHTWMQVINHCFDPSMAPAGKSEVEVWFDTEYGYWEELAKDRQAYKSEKKRIAEHTIRELEKTWPGFESQVEVADVPTPATYNRYTGNWKGSPDGWYLTRQNILSMEPVRTVEGLKGLYMAGQWTSPFTGTVIAALSGRQIIQILCRRERRKFVTRERKSAVALTLSLKDKEAAVIG